MGTAGVPADACAVATGDKNKWLLASVKTAKCATTTCQSGTPTAADQTKCCNEAPKCSTLFTTANGHCPSTSPFNGEAAANAANAHLPVSSHTLDWNALSATGKETELLAARNRCCAGGTDLATIS